MGFTSERLEQAISILRERGHVIPTYPPNQLASVGPDGLMISIDGQFRPVHEVYEMAENPPQKEQSA